MQTAMGVQTLDARVATILGIDLSGVGRGDLSAPVRLKLWSYESPSMKGLGRCQVVHIAQTLI